VSYFSLLDNKQTTEATQKISYPTHRLPRTTIGTPMAKRQIYEQFLRVGALILVLMQSLLEVRAFNIPSTYSRAHRFNRVGNGVPSPQRESSTVALRESSDELINSGDGNKLRIVVVGGGWAGYSFCESISHNNFDGRNVEIILLDASKQGGGGLAGGYRSKHSWILEGISQHVRHHERD